MGEEKVDKFQRDIVTDKLISELIPLFYTDNGTAARVENIVYIKALLDAALRRAKVEVLRDLRNTFAPCATGDTRENVDGCGNYDDYYSAGGNDAYRDVVKEIDARAAQIEALDQEGT